MDPLHSGQATHREDWDPAWARNSGTLTLLLRILGLGLMEASNLRPVACVLAETLRLM